MAAESCFANIARVYKSLFARERQGKRERERQGGRGEERERGRNKGDFNWRASMRA